MNPGRKVAQRLFWCLLLLSMVFNGAVAFLVPGVVSPYVVAVVHAVYPAMFAVSETLLVRVPKLRNRAANSVRIVCATGSALAAVAGSAKNLALLAELVGAGGYLKWTLPLVLDLPTCLAMLSTVYAADPEPAKAAPLAFDADSQPALETPKPVEATPVLAGKMAKRTTARPAKPSASNELFGPPEPVSAAKVSRSPVRSSVTSDEVATALEGDPLLTAKSLGDRFGVSAKTIRRTAAWKNRKQAVSA